MKKFAIAAVTSVTLFVSTSAFAGYWTPWGTYIPTCGFNYWGFYVCG